MFQASRSTLTGNECRILKGVVTASVCSLGPRMSHSYDHIGTIAERPQADKVEKKKRLCIGAG